MKHAMKMQPTPAQLGDSLPERNHFQPRHLTENIAYPQGGFQSVTRSVPR